LGAKRSNQAIDIADDHRFDDLRGSTWIGDEGQGLQLAKLPRPE
jgi:hypothetical protein